MKLKVLKKVFYNSSAKLKMWLFTNKQFCINLMPQCQKATIETSSQYYSPKNCGKWLLKLYLMNLFFQRRQDSYSFV